MATDSVTLTHRPMRITDAVILIAALGVALAWDRGRILDPRRWFAAPISRGTGLGQRLAYGAVNGFEFLPALLTVASVTVLGLRLRRPRPSLSQISRQPGTIACALATALMGAVILAVLASHGRAVGSPGATWARAAADLQPENLWGPATLVGFAIAVAWFVLKRKGRWQPEPTWIDRLGRLIGWGWMAMILGMMIRAMVALTWIAQLSG